MFVSRDGSSTRRHSGSSVLDHWGLWRYPFPPVPKLSEVVEIGTHGTAIRSIVRAGEPCDHVLVGPRGVGKTAILAVVGEIVGEPVVPASLSRGAAERDNADRTRSLRLLDDVPAELLPGLLCTAEERNARTVAAVRWPPPEWLERRCAGQRLEYIELRPWSRVETELAVQEAVRLAGAVRPVFTPKALAALFDTTAGLPRRIGRIVNLALLLGAARKAREITERDVQTAFEEMRALSLPYPLWRSLTPAA